jgi:hypothetical protein
VSVVRVPKQSKENGRIQQSVSSRSFLLLWLAKFHKTSWKEGKRRCKKKEEKASMAIEKWMGDAATTAAPPPPPGLTLRKGFFLLLWLLCTSSAVAMATPRRAMLACLHKKEEAFIGWMSSAALMAVEQKKARNGRGPL